MIKEGLERPFAELSERVSSRLWGKYRGLVEDVNDPQRMGRITARVPSVYGPSISPFALPAVPFAGPSHGMLLLPKKGDGVWFEFEGGDVNLPIWTGFWWAQNEMPSSASAERRVIVTPAGLEIVLDDSAKTIRLIHTAKGEITLAEDSISIIFGQSSIVLDSSGVAINGTALKVTV